MPLHTSISKVRAAVKELRAEVVSMMRDDVDESIIDAACEFVLGKLRVLFDSSLEMPTSTQTRSAVFFELRTRFPAVPDVALQRLLKPSETLLGSSVLASTWEETKEFGVGIKFEFPSFSGDGVGLENVPPNFHVGTASGGGDGLLDKFATLSTAPAAGRSTIHAPRGSGNGGSNVNALWLKRQCEHHFPGPAAVNMGLAIFDLLRSERPNEQLQGDLFDLLGDRWD